MDESESVTLVSGDLMGSTVLHVQVSAKCFFLRHFMMKLLNKCLVVMPVVCKEKNTKLTDSLTTTSIRSKR